LVRSYGDATSSSIVDSDRSRTPEFNSQGIGALGEEDGGCQFFGTATTEMDTEPPAQFAP
jgi:hypothetical protein